MVKISVVVITYNEARNLGRCLASVAPLADELVVVDSCSTDRTVEIARSFGARVITQAFLGYVEQKNFADRQASHDWILSLDADEALSPELAASIQQARQAPGYKAYHFNRLTNYCGSWIRHCGWYPDRKIRFFDRRSGSWQGQRIHERWEPADIRMPVGFLKGDLLHYSFYTLSDHLKQIEHFTEIMAQEGAKSGKRYSLLKIWFGPKWRFFTDYILKGGILDGYAGYLVCKYSAFAALVKYTKTRQYAAQLKYNEHAGN